jgi:hypothetical protein
MKGRGGKLPSDATAPDWDSTASNEQGMVKAERNPFGHTRPNAKPSEIGPSGTPHADSKIRST